MTPEEKARQAAWAEWRYKPCREAEEYAAHGGGREMVEAGFSSFGRHCPQNYGRSLYWFQKAIDNNYPGGFYYLGFMYRDGVGVEKDEKKGFDLIKKSTGLPGGDAFEYMEAWQDLAGMYSKGVGTPTDMAEAYYASTRAYLIAAEVFRQLIEFNNVLPAETQTFAQFRINSDTEQLAERKDALEKLKGQLTPEQRDAVDARIKADTAKKP